MPRSQPTRVACPRWLRDVSGRPPPLTFRERALSTGIPKFYRWLSERYPLINEPVGAAAVPVFDAIYLDMNGIIHNCTHGNDPTTKLTETEMILRIFNYLDKLVQIVKPQQLLFMAIDGALPAERLKLPT